MISRLASFLVLCLLAIAVISANGSAQEPADEDSPNTLKDKREIIELLFTDIFRGEEKEEILLSTKCIPKKLQADFPQLAKLSTSLVAAGSEVTGVCPFEFSIFEVRNDKAYVLFGNCRNGLGYNFEKVNGKWQFAPLEFEKK